MQERLHPWLVALFRPGQRAPADTRRDYLLLIGFTLLLVASGIGLRDPWPADEPRFALIARDMALEGNWLAPRVGGNLYADKPPLFFWMIAAAVTLTGSLRVAFLLPSLFSAIGCIVLVYDLARRLWNREAGLAAGILLLLSLQFVWQARQAQIDATLCFWTTLGLYGLLRHLLLGPRWGWWAVGWAAAGFGTITKGVGFLPLLVLLPFACLRAPRWSPRVVSTARWPWLLGPVAFVLAISVWLVPMLWSAHQDPQMSAYRDQILFQQTIDRYANAWHHREPFWYFFVNVIPGLWLPLTLLLPWLVPAWRQALRGGDARIALLLAWTIAVVLFFSFSTGKRGVYVLPALPALALASAPYGLELLQRAPVQRALYGLSALIVGLCAGGAAFLVLGDEQRASIVGTYAFDPAAPLAMIAALGAVVLLVTRARTGILTYAGVIAAALCVVSAWLNPAMNPVRSGATFVARLEQAADPTRPLGIVAFKEQYLLNAHRPLVHFGHARWREGEQEMFDAARWLHEDPRRQLVVTAAVRDRCFRRASATALGAANSAQWFLISGEPEPHCVQRGRSGPIYSYTPPLRRSRIAASVRSSTDAER